jgi:hypothetical protein
MKYSTLIPSFVLSVALATAGVAAFTQPTLAQAQSEPGGGGGGTPQPNAAGQPPQGGGMGMMGGQGGQAGGGMMHDMHEGMAAGSGGDMAGMMPMMHGGRMMGGGMPFDHIEGRLAFLKTELKITAAQEPQWSTFADAVRSVARSMKEMHEQMMQGGHGGGGMMRGGTQGAAAATAPARLDHYERMLTARLEALRIVKSTFDPLYSALSDEQKKTADELLSGPMGVL